MKNVVAATEEMAVLFIVNFILIMQPNLGWSGGWQRKLAILLFFFCLLLNKRDFLQYMKPKSRVYIGKEGNLFGRKKFNFLCVAIES